MGGAFHNAQLVTLGYQAALMSGAWEALNHAHTILGRGCQASTRGAEQVTVHLFLCVIWLWGTGGRNLSPSSMLSPHSGVMSCFYINHKGFSNAEKEKASSSDCRYAEHGAGSLWQFFRSFQ